MATLATAMYGAHHQSFAAGASSMTATQTVQQQQQPPASDEQYITTFFCRALYDYQTQDTSSLSFQRNDVIEVLTRLESGWWDGLLGDERGWFPSNYVTVISDEEAEAALSGSEYSLQHAPPTESIAESTNSTITATQALGNGVDWLNGDLGHSDSRNGLIELANAALDEGVTPASDFWMPQVTPEGVIFYMNTQTGQISRDLPTEGDDEVSVNDLAVLTSSQGNSRAGTSAGLGLNAIPASPVAAGFGLAKNTDIPEPWARKLADDGMSYYFLNTLTGETRWTVPEPENQNFRQERTGRSRATTGASTTSSFNHDTVVTPSRMRSDSSMSGSRQRSENEADRLSLYSNDSETFLVGRDRTGSLSTNQTLTSNGRQVTNWARSSSSHMMDDKALVELTSAERLAQALQQALSPTDPESITDLSAQAKHAIISVIRTARSFDFKNMPQEDTTLDDTVYLVVIAIRNLLYVSAAPSGHIPTHIIPGPRDVRDRRDTTASQTLLKPAQRKVTATLSKLVLSARAVQYNSGSSVADTPMRIEGDADELERAVEAFVVEVERSHKQQIHSAAYLKRLRGVFSTANIGLGLVGAGAAGNWKGHGWVSLEETEEAPGRVLGTEVVTETRSYIHQVQETFNTFASSARDLIGQSADRLYLESRNLISHLSTLLLFVSNIHIARHVDIDGIQREAGNAPSSDLYTQTVENARLLIRTLEAATQALYDDGSSLFLTAQCIRRTQSGQQWRSSDAAYDLLDNLATAVRYNLVVVQQSLEALLSIGHDQADMAQGDYNGSIEWRMSRLSVIDTQFGGAFRPISMFNSQDAQANDMVDMELAFQKPEHKMHSSTSPNNVYRDGSLISETTLSVSERSHVDDTPKGTANADTLMNTLVPLSPTDSTIDQDASPLYDEDPTASSRSPPRGEKLKKLLGPDAPQHYLNLANAETKPWYLRPTYDEKEILIDPDGTVRGGTISALVERLTAHEHGDPTFIKTFLMTYKSFTNLEELFNLLVKRFQIKPPDTLNTRELEEWGKLKQHVIQMRVINTFKSMVVDDDVLEKEDMYILNRMKEFISSEEVVKFAAAKQLLILIERAQRGGDTKVKMTVNTTQQPPPPPINPKSSKKLKLLDIDSLELARQLTILESQLYQKIRPMECLQRSREQKTDHNDNIAAVIQTSNRIANWVADSVLSKEDSRRRAAVVKQFISVADRCRGLHNYSSMVAIISGLNSPPIRRLKRTWEQVNAKFMTQLGACEMTIDSNKNFTNYRTTLAKVSPPCVPFIGVFLTTLTFVQDGSKDALPGNLINFRKRQKASEVIQDIKRWQSHPHNFQPLPNVLVYIEESLTQFNDHGDIGDLFWNLSLEREPREREDEKMARLLQESGFL